jgi:hypothetical protein
MNYATFAALTNYSTVAAALAAKPVDGQAWLLNETQIFQDGRMPKSGPAAVKNNRQTQMASSLTPTITRNQGTTSTEGYRKSTKGGGYGVNLETVSNNKSPAIRHKVAWYVTDSTQAAGYRRVFGMLEDPTTTSPYRDDDNQTRL